MHLRVGELQVGVKVADDSYHGPYRQVDERIQMEATDPIVSIRYGASNVFKISESQLIAMKQTMKAQSQIELTRDIYKRVRQQSPYGMRSTPCCGCSISRELLKNYFD